MSFLALFTIFTEISLFSGVSGITEWSYITGWSLDTLHSGQADGTDASFDALAIAQRCVAVLKKKKNIYIYPPCLLANGTESI